MNYLFRQTYEVLQALFDYIETYVFNKIGAAGGLATLNEDGKVPNSQIGIESMTQAEASEGVVEDGRLISPKVLATTIAEKVSPVAEEVEALDERTGNINERLETVEQLAEISIGGGDIGIATAEDFDDPSAAQRAKVPTVGAILDCMDEVPTAGSVKPVQSGGVFNLTKTINENYSVVIVSASGSTTYPVYFKIRANHKYRMTLESSDNFTYQLRIDGSTYLSGRTNNEYLFELPSDKEDIAIYLSSAASGKTITIKIDDISLLELNDEINEVKHLIGDKVYKEINVTLGVKLQEKIGIIIRTGDSFSIYGNIQSGLYPSNNYNLVAYTDEGLTTYTTIKQAVIVGDFEFNFTAAEDYYGVGILRGVNSIGEGTIIFNVSTYVFAERSEFDKLKTEVGNNDTAISALNDELNDLKNNIGWSVTEQILVTVGTKLNRVIPCTIKEGDEFVICGNIPRDLYTNNTYRIVAYVDEELTTTIVLRNAQFPEDFSYTYTAGQQYYAIGIERGANAINSGTITVSVKDFTFVTKEAFNVMKKDVRSLVYVDAVNGSDDNDGSSSSPFATFAKAIDSTGVDTTIILNGDISEPLRLNRKAGQRSITLMGAKGVRNRIMLGTFINSATQHEGDVYYAELDRFPSGDDYRIYQHEIPDINTLISDAERHPLQRGREYRCESINMRPMASIQDVVESSSQTYYWDSSNSRLYFKIASGSSLITNPIVIPMGNEAVSGGNGTIQFKMINVEAWYCNVNISQCNGAVIEDSAVKFAYGAGGFRWDNSIGVMFKKCEAARIFYGTTGDGFNAHSDYTPVPSNPQVKFTTCTMIDCWSHDSNDDGYSDHERCENAIHGGLFEYNGKAGVTPAYGSHLICYDVMSRRNDRGFYYVGVTTAEEGGKNGQMLCFNCVAENNIYSGGSTGVGFAVAGDGNSMRLIGCKSIGHNIGYNARDTRTSMELTDCSVADCTTDKAGNGNIVANNTTLVV